MLDGADRRPSRGPPTRPASTAGTEVTSAEGAVRRPPGLRPGTEAEVRKKLPRAVFDAGYGIVPRGQSHLESKACKVSIAIYVDEPGQCPEHVPQGYLMTSVLIEG
jgi:hypothetical protein